MEYEFFLFSMLYREVYKEETEGMNYSTMHSIVTGLYIDFINSPYDDPDDGLYDCMECFLKDSKQLIITCSK